MMQYRIEHIAGWKNPAIIRVKDGVIIGHIYVGHEDELKPYLGQGVDVRTFDELKAVVVEWYEADAGDVCGAKADKYFRRIDAQRRLERGARDLIEEGGKAEVTE